jgi:hypothetical protein
MDAQPCHDCPAAATVRGYHGAERNELAHGIVVDPCGTNVAKFLEWMGSTEAQMLFASLRSAHTK